MAVGFGDVVCIEVEAESMGEALSYALGKMGGAMAIIEVGGGRDGLRRFVVYKHLSQMVHEIKGR